MGQVLFATNNQAKCHHRSKNHGWMCSGGKGATDVKCRIGCRREEGMTHTRSASDVERVWATVAEC
jgi:hypothetical protein